MSKGRLTRHELSWLLTQEAQNAAERLRVGVQYLRTQAPPPPPDSSQDPAQGVETSLDALDDVMKMLSSLNQAKSAPAAGTAPRRGRIDVAALLVEAAPDARVSIEPGSGTEIYGEEADLRRMLQVLVGHGSGGEGVTANVRRDGDEVKITVVLGPDASPTAETERAWLSRMALRYGGRHELEGGNEILVFAAEGATSEREALRKELDEARKQGEAYARELAAVFERGEEEMRISTVPPAPGQPSIERFAAVTRICSGIASELTATMSPLVRELAALRKHEGTDEELDTVRRRASHVQAMVAELATFGELRHDELPAEIDLVEVARLAARECAAMADRDGVTVNVRVAPEGARVYIRRGPKTIHLLAREVVAYAIAASPRGASVDVRVIAGEGQSGMATGPSLVVDDAGSPLPASGRRAFLSLETHAGSYGRPSALPIFMAAELAACQGATLELSDAPMNQGGLRVAVTFAR